MNVKASIVVMSHLSDMQIEIEFGSLYDQVNVRLNFIKYIILETDGNLNLEIDPDKLYKDYLNQIKFRHNIN